MKLTYDIGNVAPYINWAYFYHAWQLTAPQQQQRIRQEAEAFLKEHAHHYHSYALFRLESAYPDGDDIMLGCGQRIACLRQQYGEICLCLADFFGTHSPESRVDSSPFCQVGLFATSVDEGMEHDFDDDPYLKMMAQLLADRLAEATADVMHQEVRRHYWGYAPDEQLSISELHQERFQGIRPAVGYPSLPDASLNFVLDELLDFGQIGIRLTENGAMKPHASVSGLMLAHPQARYFAVGKIDNDQLHDYAHRRGMPVERVRKFLAANL